ncbi:MAG: hypothetical protein OEM96_02460, partial [Gemmatimonadota bacterium]|nr:hypothetical protein [Gemmatimonadota bacterium]
MSRCVRAGSGWALLLVVLAPSAAHSQIGPSHWRADDRVVITDFQRVTALARASDRLFAATDGGLVVRNEAFDRWELPITTEDGYPSSRVVALAWDRRDATLWLSTVDSRLIQIEPRNRRFLDEIRLDEPIRTIVPSHDDPSALLVQQGSRWFTFDPFSRRQARISPSDVDRAIAASFELRERRALLTSARFEAGRAFIASRGTARYQITDVMPSAQLGQFWIASYGGFLFRYDAFSGRSEPVEYGLIGEGAAAVLADTGGIWFAPGEGFERYAISRADRDLTTWRTWDAESTGLADRNVPADPVHALLRVGADLWAGGERGLYRFDGDAWHREGGGQLGRGTRVLSLSADPQGLGGVWAGTDRGLYRLPGPGMSADAPRLGAERITALAAHGELLWVGTDRGLTAFGPDAGQREGVAVAGRPPGAVWSMTAHGGRLYVGFDREVWWLEDDSWFRADVLG